MDEKTLKVGVVGLGWAGQQHIAAYQAVPGVEVIGIAGKERELGESLLAEYGIPTLHDDWEALLELPGLDAVSVAVPTFLHAPIAIAALERGIHVLSEKPIARSGDEAQTMVDAARAAGRVLDVAFNHRRRGDIQLLHGIIESGELGTPYYAKASWMRRRGIPKLGSWFTNEAMSGGGPLADIGVHVLDYALFLLGEPEVVSVSASSYNELGRRGLGGSDRETADTTVSEYDVEDFATAFLRLSTGATLVLETSWAAYRDPVDLIDFSVLASDGGAELVVRGASLNPVGEIRVFTDSKGVTADYAPVAEEGRAHQGVIDDFIATLRDPASWAANDGSLALSRSRVIDACYRSAASGAEVRLGEVPVD